MSQDPSPTLTVLVPAYNEAPRISTVLESLCSYNHPGGSTVVVIDDGSRDGTYECAREHDTVVIRHRENRGKGAALQTGIDYIAERYGRPTPYWLFIDADLINLQHHHLDSLLEPLRAEPPSHMSVGMLTAGGKRQVDLAQKYFGILNGQRGLSDSFVQSLPDLSWAGFGVEIFLSRYARLRGAPVSFPPLPGITHYTKEEKLGLLPGIAYRLRMYRECMYSLFHWSEYCPGGERHSIQP